MSEQVVWLTIFVLSIFVGVEVISKVSSTLHTPLMSGANAIHGIILLGAILVCGYAQTTVQLVIGLVAVVLASVNMVGGFVVTDRMLQMFTRRKPPSASSWPSRACPRRGTRAGATPSGPSAPWSPAWWCSSTAISTTSPRSWSRSRSARPSASSGPAGCR
jgi:H+-translocating NAD(P) transhydrogenase subunit alpha